MGWHVSFPLANTLHVTFSTSRPLPPSSRARQCRLKINPNLIFQTKSVVVPLAVLVAHAGTVFLVLEGSAASLVYCLKKLF